MRGAEPGEDLVVSLADQPVGLLQRSPIAAYPDDLAELSAIVEVPAGAVELDYLLGEPRLRGRGLGSRMIRAVVEDTWRTHPRTPVIPVAVVAVVAVVAANLASWRALEKAGLRQTSAPPALGPGRAPRCRRVSGAVRASRPASATRSTEREAKVPKKGVHGPGC